MADASIGLVVADGFAVSDGSAGVMVADDVALLSAMEIVDVPFPGDIAKVGVEDGSSVNSTSLVFSESVRSIVAVRVRFETNSSLGFFTGAFVLVYVALRAKGVSVEVPSANLFNHLCIRIAGSC